ncbi:T9SS sorting signal type C domain-containing protein, partial [Winogradskyella sp.]|uniref:T9SS sorting signal type C domain-containing protein n=1 Tax=Winogradskyella sp. TaxID=1883156 RepID=UPI003513CDEB
LFRSDQYIFIEDLFYNIVHNIKESPYIFESDLGYINDRFILRYTNTTLGVEDINPLDGIRVFEENETIIVKSDYENIQSIEVYDILGRNLFANKSINADRFYINSIKPSEQTLFLKIKLTNGGHKIEKIIF